MARIVISMEGGFIQGIVSDQPVDIYVIDYDTEGEEGHPHLTKLGGDECILFPVEPDIEPNVVGLIEKTWKTA